MELLEAMLNRRSVRRYTQEEIPEEKLEKILQAGLLARQANQHVHGSLLLYGIKKC